MVFSLFSYTAIIPVLQVLFGLQQVEKVYQAWTWDNSMKEIGSAMLNNLYAWVVMDGTPMGNE